MYGHSTLPSVSPGRPLEASLNETDLLTWRQAMVALNTVMTLDMNFRRATNATWAVEYVKAIDSVIGWDNVVALEVGNEVDLYGGGERYRPSGYGYKDYKTEYLYYVQSIQAAVPNLPKRIFQGFATCCAWDWVASDLADYISNPTIESSLYSVSEHDYPVPSCDGERVTIADILNDAYSSSTSQFLKQHDTIAMLRQHNISFVVGEGSEAVCNGDGPMVLNTFATALWVVDQLFLAASVGVEHFYFHSWGTDTATFSVLVYGNRAAPDRFLVQPIYYGIKLFGLATANHARIINMTGMESTNRHIHAYAALASGTNELTVTVVHKDLNATGRAYIEFSLPLSHSTNATLIRLVAPTIESEYNVTLAGQTYDGSVDGSPIGAWKEESVSTVGPTNGTVSFGFYVDPLSAVMVRIMMSASEGDELVKQSVTMVATE